MQRQGYVGGIIGGGLIGHGHIKQGGANRFLPLQRGLDRKSVV